MLNRISISQKILLAFAFVLVCLLAVNIYSLLEIRKISTIVNQLTAVQFNLWDDCQKMEQATDNTYKGMRKYLLLKKPTYAEMVEDNIEDARNTINTILQYPLATEQNLLRVQLTKQISTFHALLDEMFELHESSEAGTYIENMKLNYEQCKNTLAEFQLFGYREINRSFLKTRDITNQYEHDLIIFSALTCLALLIMFLWINYSIRHSLSTIITGMKKITQGDFSTRIQGFRDREIGKLAIYYNIMANRLTEFDEVKSSFIANLSHEIKTPLTSMRESLSLLQEKIAGPLNEKQTRLVKINLGETNRIIKIVSDLLDISRIRAGVISYNFALGKLADLLRSRMMAADSLAAKKNISLNLELENPLPAQKFDALRLGQVIDNLLSNAIKFTPEGGTIEIKVGSKDDFIADHIPPLPDKLAGNFIFFSIADSGTGIPDTLIDQIFVRFQQGNQWLPDHGKGSGVGLSIAKFFIEGHNGLIWAHNRSVGGCVFHVIMPEKPGKNNMVEAKNV